MIRRTARFVTGLAAAAAITSPVAAQATWQAIGTPGNTVWTTNTPARPFWNNSSQDGSNCNIGHIVTGAATGGCGSQRPSGWLPYQGTPMTHFYAGSGGTTPTSILFAPGVYNFTQAGRLGGDVAGRDMAWGIFTTNGTTRTIVQTFAGGTTPIPSTTLTLGQNWGFFIQLARLNGADLPNGIVAANNVYSDETAFLRHFALFTNTNTLGATTPLTAPNFTPFVMGMEDIGCTRIENLGGCNADFDNNDVVVSFAPVPEPSTYALMATGLAGMGMLARRRRRA